MSIIGLANKGISTETDPEVLEADTECEIRITDVGVDTDKNSHAYFLPRFEPTEHPDAKDFTKFFHIPDDWMDAKRMKSSKNAIRKFAEAFGFDPDEDLDTDNLIGLTGWAILGVEEDAQYGDKNYVKRFVAGN